jgi:ABC-type antimicrobial peptide transport system permease subunit
MSDSIPLGGTVSDVSSQQGTRSQLFAGMEAQGRPPGASGTGGLVAWRQVTPEYFQALGIPIIRGRGLTEEDRKPGHQTIVISDLLAQQLFPNQDAIGKQIRTAPQGVFKTIVGIAGNVKNNPELAAGDDPEYYIPRMRDESEGFPPQAAVILRTNADAAVAAATIRTTIGRLDRALPLSVYTMNQRVAELAARPRFNAILTGWFASAGVLLSVIGLYGVISFAVAQREQEIGVRIALGAVPANIINLVLAAAFRWTIAGLLAGLVGSLLTTRLIRTLLFHVPERDPWTLSITVLLILLVSLLAALLPSVRASRTAPMSALRND